MNATDRERISNLIEKLKGHATNPSLTLEIKVQMVDAACWLEYLQDLSERLAGNWQNVKTRVDIERA